MIRTGANWRPRPVRAVKACFAMRGISLATRRQGPDFTSRASEPQKAAEEGRCDVRQARCQSPWCGSLTGLSLSQIDTLAQQPRSYSWNGAHEVAHRLVVEPRRRLCRRHHASVKGGHEDGGSSSRQAIMPELLPGLAQFLW